MYGWLSRELACYADPKWDTDPATRQGHDERMASEGVGPESFWRDQVMQYVHRAHVLGLDTPRGRQVLAKGFAAYLGMCESMTRVYGEPPQAGVPSGEIVEATVGP